MREVLRKIWTRFRGLPMWAQVPIAIFAGLFVIGVMAAPFTEPEDDEEVSSRATTSTVAQTTTLPPTTTTTLPPLPPGDDTAVTRVTDGDSLVVSDGTRVRLIGIDAPEVESSDCFSSEATDHLRQLAGPGTRVRLVYDTERLDRFGRTLAYVYRLSDGLFVNLVLARDGYALQLTVPPNVAHAEEFRQAVAEARDANRGLWASCQTTTTQAPTTRAPIARAPTPDTTAAAGGNCSAAYPDFCIPPPPPDLDCADAGGRGFTVLPPDPHRFDADRDGIGCER